MFEKVISEPEDKTNFSDSVIVKTIAMRQEFGAYYTPLRVAEILTKWAIRDDVDSVLEPCFGGCDFLEAIRERLISIGKLNYEKYMFGCDIDQDAFSYLSNKINASTQSGNFLRTDFLTTTAAHFNRNKFSVVIGNPPYIKIDRVNEVQRENIERLPDAVRNCLNGKANLWAYFVIHAISFLEKGGRMAWVLPGNFLSANYSKKLKLELVKRFQKVTAISVSERLFLSQGTEERTVVLICDGYGVKADGQLITKYCKSVGDLATLIDSEINQHNRNKANVSECDYELITKEQSDSFRRVINKTNAQPLSEFGRAHIGIVLGDKKFFVRTVADWANTKISSTYIVPIVSKFGYLSGLQLNQFDIESWRDRNLPCFMLNTRNKRLGSRVLEYLATSEQHKLGQNSTFTARDIWHQPDDGYLCDAFIASLHQSGPRMVLNEGNIQATNSLYRFSFSEKTGISKRKLIAVSLLTTLSQLSSEMVGRQLGSGALKLEPSEVSKISLCVPENKSDCDISKTFHEVDSLIRRNLIHEARVAADAFIFSDLIPKNDLESLRLALDRIRAHRRRDKTPL